VEYCVWVCVHTHFLYAITILRSYLSTMKLVLAEKLLSVTLLIVSIIIYVLERLSMTLCNTESQIVVIEIPFLILFSCYQI